MSKDKMNKTSIKWYVVLLTTCLLLLALSGIYFAVWEISAADAAREKSSLYNRTSQQHASAALEILNDIEKTVEIPLMAVALKGAPNLSIAAIPFGEVTNLYNELNERIDALTALQNQYGDAVYRPEIEVLSTDIQDFNLAVEQLRNTQGDVFEGVNGFLIYLHSLQSSLNKIHNLHFNGQDLVMRDLIAQEEHKAMQFVVIMLLFIGVSLFAMIKGLRLLNTGRRREMEALAVTARLGRILDDSWNEIYVFDGETYKFIQVNKGALRNMGFSMDEMREFTAYDIKPMFDHEGFAQAVQPLRDGTEQFLIFEAVHQRKDGTCYPVEVRLQYLPDESPSIFVAVINNITKRKEAESEIIALNESLERRVVERTTLLEREVAERTRIQDTLEASDARTRQIVNSAVDAIITIDEHGIIDTYNSAAEQIFGYSVTEAAGRNVSMLMPQEMASKHGDYMARYLETGDKHVVGNSREVIAKRKNGETFLADIAISEFRHGNKINFVGIVRDITERKEAEYRLKTTLNELQQTQSSLVQAEKMASLGGLVAGVAHEINTPIGIGVTAVSHLKERADHVAKLFAKGELRKSDFADFVDASTASTGIIQANLNRASDLIKSFKQVAVDQTSDEKRQINLLGYVDEVLESLKPNLRRTKHEITVKGDRDIMIDTHPGALSQIITNLVMNSVIHAYGEDEAGHIEISAEKNGKSLSLTYSDDGKGMDEDVCCNIFEPFFTTKRGSGGSGLGMHILFNQVTQTLGGNIELHSTPGRGTAFDITIPYKSDDLQAGELQ